MKAHSYFAKLQSVSDDVIVIRLFTSKEDAINDELIYSAPKALFKDTLMFNFVMDDIKRDKLEVGHIFDIVVSGAMYHGGFLFEYELVHVSHLFNN